MTAGVISQRDYMRKLATELGAEKSAVCSAYARAESLGIVRRQRNTGRKTPAEYAHALWEDGVKKGWLPRTTVSSGYGLTSLSATELLVLHARIGEELRDRNIVRSANNPTGDLAEYLFCRAFAWQQVPNSVRGLDAVGQDGVRYQIKGRRIHHRNKSRQLSAIRNIERGLFDVLAGVLFDADFTVIKAALIPAALVVERSVYTTHTNSSRFMLYDDIWNAPGVRDVTAEIAAAMP